MFDTNEIDWTIVILIIVAIIVAAFILTAMRKKSTNTDGRGEKEIDLVVGMGDDAAEELAYHNNDYNNTDTAMDGFNGGELEYEIGYLNGDDNQ